MYKVDIIKVLKEFKKNYKKEYGIIFLGIFGSVAKDLATDKSDVDIVVKLTEQDLFNIIGIKQDLEKYLHTTVDVISYREKMNAFLKKRIDKEVIYV